MLLKSFEDGLHQNHWETYKTSGFLDLTPRELCRAGFWGVGVGSGFVFNKLPGDSDAIRIVVNCSLWKGTFQRNLVEIFRNSGCLKLPEEQLEKIQGFTFITFTKPIKIRVK